MDDRGMLFVVLFAYDTGELTELFIIKLREQWDVFEKIDIRHHDLTLTPEAHTTILLGAAMHHIGG
jgi:hypothetical protein